MKAMRVDYIKETCEESMLEQAAFVREGDFIKV